MKRVKLGTGRLRYKQREAVLTDSAHMKLDAFNTGDEEKLDEKNASVQNRARQI